MMFCVAAQFRNGMRVFNACRLVTEWYCYLLLPLRAINVGAEAAYGNIGSSLTAVVGKAKTSDANMNNPAAPGADQRESRAPGK